MHCRILLVDDDKPVREALGQTLELGGFSVTLAASFIEATDHITADFAGVVISDVRMPGKDGFALLERAAKIDPDLPVVLLTGEGDIPMAVRAINAGAFHFLEKPCPSKRLIEVAEKACARRRMVLENRDMKRRITREDAASRLILGRSAATSNLRAQLRTVAATGSDVLITGETGTGKELAARVVHELSGCTGDFVAINCGMLTPEMTHTTLFGTGDKAGAFVRAQNGTLFLDEIGEIGPPIQAKLLRVLETGEFRRLGGTQDLTSNARVLAATNRDLEAMSQEGEFRQDLFYRLGAFVIAVPPLRHRREDIPALVDHFLNHHDFSRRISKKLTRSAMRRLTGYDWPGNVRELRNVIERAIIISGDDKTIHAEDLGLTPDRSSTSKHIMLSFDHEPTLEEIKKSYISDLLHKYAGHRSRLASILGISERNIYRLIKKYDLGKD